MREKTELESRQALDDKVEVSEPQVEALDTSVSVETSDSLLEINSPSNNATAPHEAQSSSASGTCNAHNRTCGLGFLTKERQGAEHHRPSSGSDLNNETTTCRLYEQASWATGFATPPHSLRSENCRLPDTAAAALPSPTSGLLSPRIWKTQFFWPNAYTTNQCICLMRHYIQSIAPSVSDSIRKAYYFLTIIICQFDTCDPQRHFSSVVPQRARRCPPLLNAVFTAAARHLARMSRYQTADGAIKYEGILLPNLTTTTAVSYHNACLAYLIELSHDPEHVQDEDLLAAVVVLRHYEELDTSLTGEDHETFLTTFRVFINAQADTVFSPPIRPEATSVYGSLNMPIPDADLLKARSFRRAAFRIALRQEVTSAFMKQRAVRLPLDAWTSERTFDEAEDIVWVDRLILFCADALQFCFGDESISKRLRIDRWNELKGFERLWELKKPLTFPPIHYREPDRAQHECFPQIWYLSECHSLGLQYFDLARILLTVYDPIIPRLGPGSVVATRRVSATVREIVLNICGTAISNGNQPSLVMAALAIALCGAYFTEHDEQRSMIDILLKLDNEHAWPITKTVAELEQAWSQA